MKNRLLLILAASTMLVSCGANESNSSANSTDSNYATSSSSSFSFSEQSISSSQYGSEVTGFIAKQRAISALKKATEATLSADALKVSSSQGKFKTDLKGSEIPLEYNDEEGNKISKKVSGSLYLNTANLSLSVSAENLSEKDASKINAYGEVSGDMEMKATGEVADELTTSSAKSGSGTFSGNASAKAYLSSDWAYADISGVNSWLTNNGYKELTNTKFKANITDTKEYIDSLNEESSSSSEDSSASSSFDFSGSNIIRIIGVMSSEQHVYKLDSETQEVVYTLDYSLIKSELDLVGYSNETLKNIADNLPSKDDVKLEESTVYFVFKESGLVSSGINFKGEILESNPSYYGSLEAVHALSYTYDKDSLDIKDPGDTSSFKDVTPKKEDSTGE